MRWEQKTKIRAKYYKSKTFISALPWANIKKRSENALPSQQNGNPLAHSVNSFKSKLYVYFKKEDRHTHIYSWRIWGWWPHLMKIDHCILYTKLIFNLIYIFFIALLKRPILLCSSLEDNLIRLKIEYMQENRISFSSTILRKVDFYLFDKKIKIFKNYCSFLIVFL